MRRNDADGAVARGYLVVTAFLSGFSVMVLEMAAVRAMAPYFGASDLIWTNVIGVILAALAVGYFVGGRMADRRPVPGLLYGVVLGGGLLALVVPLVLPGLARWLIPADLGLESAAGHVFRASLVATMLLFAPPVLLLGGVSPITIKLLARADDVGNAAGRVFAASTVGSILGTFLTTLQLIPWLGTKSTIVVAGCTLTVTALTGMLVFAVSRKGLAAGGIGACALVVLFLAGSGAVKASPDQIEEVESAYQYIRVRDVEDGGESVRMLQINEAEEAYQSVLVAGSYLTGGRYYDYYAALPLLLGAPEREQLDCLVVGLAAGTIPRQLRHFYPRGLKVVGVEIDEEVLVLGRRYFELPTEEDWLLPRVMDGRVFLKAASTRPRFDLIIIDAFAQEYYIPFHLATQEAFGEAMAALRDGGILAMNVSAYRSDEALLSAIEQTAASVFGLAHRVEVEGYPNCMIFAMKGRQPPFGRLASPPSTGPAEWRELTRIARNVAATSETILPRPGGLILTDDLAPVERLTDELVERESRAVLGD